MLKIYVHSPKAGDFLAFHWTRDYNPEQGCERAFIDAKKFNIEIDQAWAVDDNGVTLASISENLKAA